MGLIIASKHRTDHDHYDPYHSHCRIFLNMKRDEEVIANRLTQMHVRLVEKRTASSTSLSFFQLLTHLRAALVE